MKTRRSRFFEYSKKELIMRLKKNDNQAWASFLRMKQNSKEHAINILYDRYGAEEMTSNGLTKDECEAVMDAAIVEAVSRFIYDDKVDENINYKKLLTYTHCYAMNELRRTIEKYNGVSKYMAGYLLHIKKLKLDLWESSDEELIAALMTMKCHIRDFNRLLPNIRKYFSAQQSYNMEQPEEKEPVRDEFYDELTPDEYDDYLQENSNEPVSDDCFEDISYKIRAEKVRLIVGKKNYDMFCEYYLQGDKHPSIRMLSQKYELTPYFIKEKLRFVKNVFRSEYAEEAKLFAKEASKASAKEQKVKKVLQEKEQTSFGENHFATIADMFEIL